MTSGKCFHPARVTFILPLYCRQFALSRILEQLIDVTWLGGPIKRTRLSKSQIVAILQEGEAGVASGTIGLRRTQGPRHT